MALHESLKKLYLVDQQVRGLQSRLDVAQRQVNLRETRIDQLQQSQSDLRDQLQHARAEAALLEEQVGGLDEKIGRLREQMNNAKTNKEYSAFLLEVNTFKADKGKLEEQALEQMNRAEELKKQVDELQDKIDEQQKLKEVADRELAAREAEVGDRLAELNAEREEAGSQVPPEALAVFERLADSMDGEALASIQADDHRRMEYSCGGCYMQLPIEIVNRVISKDELVRCPSCTRILYIEAETLEAMGMK